MKTQKIQSIERLIDHFYKFETFLILAVIVLGILLSFSCLVILAWLDLNEMLLGIQDVSLAVIMTLLVSGAIGIALSRKIVLSMISRKNNSLLSVALLKQLLVASLFLIPAVSFFGGVLALLGQREEQSVLLQHTAYVLAAFDTAGLCVFIIWMLLKHMNAISMIFEQRNSQIHQEEMT